MAVTNPSDLFIPEVCLDYSRQAFTQSLQLYNGLMGPAGRGAPIEIVDEPMFDVQGQYIQRPVFKRIGSGLVARRDVTSNSTVTPVNLTGDNDIGVKINRRIGPVDVTKDAARLSKATPEEISAEIGKQAGEELALNVQTSVINALVGIVGGVTASANTYTAWSATSRTNLSPSVLNATLNLMGDYRETFRKGAKILTRSECVLDLANDGIGRSYTNVGDRALQGVLGVNTLGMGEPVVVDAAPLTVPDAGFDKYYTLLLGAGAMQIYFPLPLTIYPLFQILDQEQVLDRWRADFDFALSTNGAKWDVSNGGANPTDASLATTTNWDATFTRHQEVKILQAIHNYSGN